jgi:S1-C subfamily serine protease
MIQEMNISLMILIPNPDYHFEDNVFSFGSNLRLSENDEISVEGIWENSPADMSNIQVGDLITEFNSKKTSRENFMELQEMIQDKKIKAITLTVKNQSGIKQIQLHKKMLF